MNTKRTPSSKPGDLPGAVKSPDSPAEPLVGSERTEKAPVQRATTKSEQIKQGPHGPDAVATLAVERGDEAESGRPSDARQSAEAVDQGVSPIAVERAELDAATHAEALDRIEREVGPENFSPAITAAGDKAGDHVKNVRKAAKATAKAASNVKRGRAFQALKDHPKVDSPHGRIAEEHDSWTAARWAPHGDMNLAADSDAMNTVAAEQNRGLRGDSLKEIAKHREGESLERERYDENRRALKNVELNR